MATIRDVAQRAGVSTATVSRVLANHPHVRPDVRARVLEAVRALEYQPNQAARTLRSQQSNTIALIVSDIRNPFFTAISRAVEDTAYLHGYRVLLCNTDEDPTKEELYLDLMRAERVAGVILSPTRRSSTQREPLALDFPLVAIDRPLRNGAVDAVLLDNVAAARALTEHLLEQGYTRIGGIFGESSTTGRERRRGYEEALRAAGHTPAGDLVRVVAPRTEAGQRAALELLRLNQPPDALVTSNSLLLAGALQAIRACSLRLPQQIGLVGFDDTDWAALVEPAITVLAQPTDEIGRTATELLLQRIAEPERPARTVILQGQLRVRGSSLRRG
ncbi:LacI family DNA-binding transcriptional regulator [Kallotenue papyrolyticum]|uniref:LacI family DNA-binding transcriptional regulator n=1 Tax=Kallotenue papyrolyticum TaxID=1325125 RepID=UPI0004926469|nr:LacI family DNA-binding transcriptional regulator [Kallotenue papyrolyticum]